MQSIGLVHGPQFRRIAQAKVIEMEDALMFDLAPDEGWHGRGGMGWQLVDPRPIKAEAPYTFFTPSAQELAALVIGDAVLLAVEPESMPGGAAERLWVRLQAQDGDLWQGLPDVASGPVPLGLSTEKLIEFQPFHVWAVPECRVDDLENEARYLARAHIDPRILTGAGQARLLVRRAPTEAEVGYADTGWFAYASDAADVPDGQLHHGPIGLLLNRDDSMMALLRAPVGAQLQRWDEGWRLLK